MKISMVHITVIGAKYDLFAQQNEPSTKKLLCQALRFICHLNSCDLAFTSIKEDKPLKNFKNIMNWHLYEKAEYPPVEKDSNNAVFFAAGTDNLYCLPVP